MRKTSFFIVLCLFLLQSCGEEQSYVPKPRAYPRIVYPEKVHARFQRDGVPYSFEMPLYCTMEKDSSGVYTQQPYWYNLNFKPFNATLHITYYRFKDWQQFDSLVSDTRKLAYKHLQRADDIPEIPVYRKDGLRGHIFDIKGNTATHMNFYLTDSSRNFFRGALYFNKQTNIDSIAPVVEFVKQDIQHLISTFKWN